MSNINRYRFGETDPVISPPIANTVAVQIGDLVERTSGNAVQPAASHVWNTNIATTQAEFHDIFLGVSQQQSRTADILPIRVATKGTFEFDCAAATFKIGDFVGPAKQTGNLMENQKVVAVADQTMAIGRVAADYSANTTRVLVRINSSIMDDGCQAIT